MVPGPVPGTQLVLSCGAGFLAGALALWWSCPPSCCPSWMGALGKLGKHLGLQFMVQKDHLARWLGTRSSADLHPGLSDPFSSSAVGGPPTPSGGLCAGTSRITGPLLFTCTTRGA